MWHNGDIGDYEYQAKCLNTSSQYGIGGNGRISKLSIRKNGKELYNYDRGLNFNILDEEGEIVLTKILVKYNSYQML